MNQAVIRIVGLFIVGAALAVVMLTPGGERLRAAVDDSLRAEMLARPLTPDLAGEGSVDATGPRAYRSIVANADNSMVQPFLFGQRNFDAVWDHEPVINPTIDGLGPMFNRTSCRECHSANGRGHPPQNVGDPMKSMLVRLSIPGEDPHGGPNPVPNYGDQLQDRAVKGVPPEGRAIIEYEEIPGEFGDGTPYSLRKPTLKFVDMAYGDLPADTLASPRVAPTVIGLGYLQAIAEETLRALEDPDDADGDGISGRVNMAWDAVTQTMMPGRFGWKANVPSLRHQSAGAAPRRHGADVAGVPGRAVRTGADRMHRRGGPHRREKRRAGFPRGTADADRVVHVPDRRAAPAQCRRPRRFNAVSNCSAAPVASAATCRRWSPAPANFRRCRISRFIRSPTCSCTTWARGWPTTGRTSVQAAANGARRRCGASA